MKSRVRMILVLVCVFVVLPVVGGLVYSFSVSAEAAARYYAEAIAQGRFEDAMGVESDEADKGSGIELGGVVDLRQGHFVAPNSVGSVRVYPELDVWGRQGASIDLSVNGRTITREIYLERVGVPRPHVGMWRVVSGAAQVEMVRAYGYASDVSVGGVSLGALGASGDGGATFPVAASTDGLWHAGSGGAVVYAYPGIYDVSVAKVSEHTQVAVDSVSGASTLSVLSGSREHQIDVTQDESTRAWHEEQLGSVASSCVLGDVPEGAVCSNMSVAGAERVDVEAPTRDSGDLLKVSVAAYRNDEGIAAFTAHSRVCFDEAGERYIVFTLLRKWVDGRQVR